MWKSKAYKSYYDVLNLQRDCTAEDIQKSYIKLSKLYHPDKNIGKEYSHEEFVNIREAYATLKNPDKRRKYDYFLSNKYYKKFEGYDNYYKTHGYAVDLSDSFWSSGSNEKFKDSYFFRLLLMPNAFLVTTFILIFLVTGEHMLLLKNNKGNRMTINDDSFMLSLICENAEKQRRILGLDEQIKRMREGTMESADPKKLVDEYYKSIEKQKNK